MRDLVFLGLVLIFVTSCEPKSAQPSITPKPDDTKTSTDVLSLSRLGKSVFEAFITGEISQLEPHALWGVPRETLYASMQHVYTVDARVTRARIQAVPLTNRTEIHTNELRKLEKFLAAPQKEFEGMKDSLSKQMTNLRRQHESVLLSHSGNDSPAWGSLTPSVIVRPGIHFATPLPEGAVDILFTHGNQSYQLKLNNCVKLPECGWILGADLEFVDLQAQANAEKEWSEDFPAAQVRASDEKKQLLVNFSGSDWSAPCITFRKNILNSSVFLAFAKSRFVLVNVDFPRNRPQSDNQKLANQILTQKYIVNDFPTVLILEANGTETQRISNFKGTNPTDFVQLLNKNKK